MAELDDNFLRALVELGISPRAFADAISQASTDEERAEALATLLAAAGVRPEQFFDRLAKGGPVSAQGVKPSQISDSEVSKVQQMLRESAEDLVGNISTQRQQNSQPRLSPAEAMAIKAAAGHRYFRPEAGSKGFSNLGLLTALLQGVGEARLDMLLQADDLKRKLSWQEWYVIQVPHIGRARLLEDEAIPGIVENDSEPFDAARIRLVNTTGGSGARLDSATFAARLMESFWRVARAEDMSEATREQMSDLILLLLNRVVGLTRGHDSYGRFLVTLYRMLAQELQAQAAPPLGILQSMAGVGDLAGHLNTQDRFLHLAVAIYGDVLEFLASRMDAVNTNADVWNRARIVANNISGHLSKLGRMDAGVDPGLEGAQRRVAELVNRMQVISACGTAVGEIGTEAYPNVWTALGFDVARLSGGDSLPSQRLSQVEALVRSMNNVLSGWTYLDPELYPHSGEHEAHGYMGNDVSLMLAFLGSLLRAAYALHEEKGLDEPGSSFFNAGLSIERASRIRPGGKRQAFLEASLSLYGAGACWALARGNTLEQAMNEFHGGACMVNLFGNLSRIPARTDPAVLERLQPIALSLAVTASSGMIRLANWEKMRNSLTAVLGQEVMETAVARARSQRLAAPMLGHQLTSLLKALLPATGQSLAADSLPSTGIWGEGPGFVEDVVAVLRDSVARIAPLMRDDESGLEGRPAAEAGKDSYESSRAIVEDLLFNTVELLSRPRLLKDLVLPDTDGPAGRGDSAGRQTALQRALDGTTLNSTISDQARRLWLPPKSDANPLPASYREWFSQAGTFEWVPGIRLVRD